MSVEACAVLLAAGAAARFGGDKLAAMIDGDSVISHAAQAVAASGCAARAAILSEKSAVHAPLLKSLGFETIINAHAAEGMSTSLREGAAWADRIGAARVLIALADMPFVRPAHLRALIERSQQCDAGAAYTLSGARRSPPAVFSAAWYDDLRALKGDKGAREILSGLPEPAAVEAPEESLRDIDTPQDLNNISL